MLLLSYSEDGRIMFLQNVGKYLPHYTASHPPEFQASQQMYCFTDPHLLLSKFRTTTVSLSWRGNDFNTYRWADWVMHETKLLPAAKSPLHRM
jgi:hypothetical protein